MARKYSRDNRGRFASSGSGATARGGRLRTASGNKRKTQTMKAAGAGGAGVMKGKVARDPGAAAKRTTQAMKPAPVAPIGRSQGQLKGFNLNGGSSNPFALTSANPPAFFGTKKKAAAFAKQAGWAGRDVIPASSRMFDGWIIGQQTGTNSYRVLAKRGGFIEGPSPGLY